MILSGNYYSYLQLFRNGVIEAVNTTILEKTSIPSLDFENELISGIDNCFNSFKEV